MIIYIAECYDRHTDPVIKVFDSSEAAIDYAKCFVRRNSKHPWLVQEKNITGYLYYCWYSSEGDYVSVKKDSLIETRA